MLQRRSSLLLCDELVNCIPLAKQKVLSLTSIQCFSFFSFAFEDTRSVKMTVASSLSFIFHERLFHAVT